MQHTLKIQWQAFQYRAEEKKSEFHHQKLKIIYTPKNAIVVRATARFTTLKKTIIYLSSLASAFEAHDGSAFVPNTSNYRSRMQTHKKTLSPRRKKIDTLSAGRRTKTLKCDSLCAEFI